MTTRAKHDERRPVLCVIERESALRAVDASCEQYQLFAGYET